MFFQQFSFCIVDVCGRASNDREFFHLGRLHISQLPNTLLLMNVQWAHVHDSPLLAPLADPLPNRSAMVLDVPEVELAAPPANAANAESLELNGSDLEVDFD
jgi:hypothetical protein